MDLFRLKSSKLSPNVPPCPRVPSQDGQEKGTMVLQCSEGSCQITHLPSRPMAQGQWDKPRKKGWMDPPGMVFHRLRNVIRFLDQTANLKAQYGGSTSREKTKASSGFCFLQSVNPAVHLVAEHPGKKYGHVAMSGMDFMRLEIDDVATFEMDLEEFCNLFWRNVQNLVLGGSPSKMPIRSCYSDLRVALTCSVSRLNWTQLINLGT